MQESDQEALHRLPLVDWRPHQQLRATETVVDRPAVPAVDVHNHLGRWLTAADCPASDWMIEDPGAFVATLDDCGVTTVVNLDGMWGPR